MRKALLPCIGALLPMLAPTGSAQCGGNGPATLEFISVDNTPIDAGGNFIMRLTGTPNSFFCLICDFGAGPVKAPGLGTFCLDLSQNLIEFVAEIPATGILEIPVRVPALAVKATLCCQWFGVDGNRNLTGLSNAVCAKLNEPCKNGINELRYITRVPKPSKFPARVDSVAHSGGKTFAACIERFDPKNPPSFPFTQDNTLFIEKITCEDDMLVVQTRINNGKDKNGVTCAFPGSGLDPKVCVNGHCWKTWFDVSCRKKIGVGMAFGKFRITGMCPSEKASTGGGGDDDDDDDM